MGSVTTHYCDRCKKTVSKDKLIAVLVGSSQGEEVCRECAIRAHTSGVVVSIADGTLDAFENQIQLLKTQEAGLTWSGAQT